MGGEQMGTLGKNGAWDDYPNYTWDGLTLNLFCSITFIVKVTHKQQHRFIFFFAATVTGNYSNNPNLTWFERIRNPSATINRTIN